MRTLLLTLATLTFAAGVQASESAKSDAEATSTVRVHSVDMKGKPPFKRDVEVLEVSDAAALEESAPAKTSRAPKGRPPMSRFR